MSGTRAQSFGIRLSLDGAETVESGLRRVQQAATQTATAVEQAGGAGGQMLAVIERGTGAASQGLTKLGGDFAALAPIVETAGGSVGRLVASLGTGAGFLGVLGAAGAAISATILVMQNWEQVTRAVGTALQAVGLNINAAGTAAQSAEGYTNTYNSALDRLNATLLTTAQRAAIAAEELFKVERQAALVQGEQALGQLFEQRSSNIEASNRTARDLEAARVGLARAEDRAARGSPAAAAAADARRAEVARLEALQAQQAQRQADLNRQERDLAGALDRRRAEIYPTPAGPEAPQAPRRSGGGGGGAVALVDPDLAAAADFVRAQPRLMDQHAQSVESAAQRIVASLEPATAAQERYAQTLRDIEAAEQEGIFSADRASDLRQRALSTLNDELARTGEGLKDLTRLSDGVGKSLAGAFEDLVFEGRNAVDVMRDLERSLLRLGNQYFLQPLFQQGANYLFGGGNSQGGGALGGLVNSVLGSFGGAAGGAKGAIDALQAAGTLVSVFHDGGLVGAGAGAGRVVPMSVFAGAPRYHGGGLIGPDERPVIAQVGERILNRQETAAYERGGGITVINQIHASDAESFRRSRGQIQADMARSIARGQRNR